MTESDDKPNGGRRLVTKAPAPLSKLPGGLGRPLAPLQPTKTEAEAPKGAPPLAVPIAVQMAFDRASHECEVIIAKVVARDMSSVPLWDATRADAQYRLDQLKEYPGQALDDAQHQMSVLDNMWDDLNRRLTPSEDASLSQPTTAAAKSAPADSVDSVPVRRMSPASAGDFVRAYRSNSSNPTQAGVFKAALNDGYKGARDLLKEAWGATQPGRPKK